jgi:hypothetical protein
LISADQNISSRKPMRAAKGYQLDVARRKFDVVMPVGGDASRRQLRCIEEGAADVDSGTAFKRLCSGAL